MSKFSKKTGAALIVLNHNPAHYADCGIKKNLLSRVLDFFLNRMSVFHIAAILILFLKPRIPAIQFLIAEIYGIASLPCCTLWFLLTSGMFQCSVFILITPYTPFLAFHTVMGQIIRIFVCHGLNQPFFAVIGYSAFPEPLPPAPAVSAPSDPHTVLTYRYERYSGMSSDSSEQPSTRREHCEWICSWHRASQHL